MSQSPQQGPQLPPTSHLPSIPVMHIRQLRAGPPSLAKCRGSPARVYSVQIPPGHALSTVVFSNGGTNQQQHLPTTNHGAPDKPAADVSGGTDSEAPSNVYIYVPIIGLAPSSYVAELRQRNGGTEGGRTEQELLYLATLECGVHLDREEKSRVFWKVWVDMQTSGLCATCKDGAGGRSLLEDKLKQYSWYRGDTTVEEATNAMKRISEMDADLRQFTTLVGNLNQAEGEKKEEEGKQQES